MTTEDSQYEYDEIRWLTRDTRKSRRRALWLTAGLTLGAMTLATIYVSREPTPAPGAAGRSISTPNEVSPITSLSVDLRNVESRLDTMNTHLEKIAENLSKLPFQINVVSEAPAGLNSVVWLVEGSRRFPMAIGDVLWIPEADSWVRLTGVTVDPDRANAWIGTGMLWSRASGPPGTAINLPAAFPVEAGSTNCVQLKPLGPSTRPNFRGYYDIEVFFFPQNAGESCTVQ